MLGRREGSYVEKDRISYSKDSINLFYMQTIDLKWFRRKPILMAIILLLMKVNCITDDRDLEQSNT